MKILHAFLADEETYTAVVVRFISFSSLVANYALALLATWSTGQKLLYEMNAQRKPFLYS